MKTALWVLLAVGLLVVLIMSKQDYSPETYGFTARSASENHGLFTLEKINSGIHLAQRILTFAAVPIWLTGFYILYQMYRLKFLKWLVWAQVFYLFEWIYTYRHNWFPEAMFSNWSLSMIVFSHFFNRLIYFVPEVLDVVGAIMGVMWLQDRFREFNAKKENNGTAAPIETKTS